MLICTSIRWHHLFPQISREWQLGCLTKVTVYASCRGGWLVYSAVVLWIVPRQGHVVVVTVSFTILFVPIIAMCWPSFGKFVASLTNILFMTYHTSRDVNAKICASQALVLVSNWNIWYHGFVIFSIATTKCTVLTWPWATFGLLSCLV